MKPCMGLVGRIFGHQFEPRYSLSAPLTNANIKADDLERVINATRARTYEGDVCVRCGQITGDAHPTPGGD